MLETLRDYIRKSFSQGLRKPQIEANLLQSGWTKEQIADAFERIEFSQKEFIEKHKKSFLPPKNFLAVIILTFFLFSLIYHFFLYIDVENGCYIKIIPSYNQILSPKRFKRDLKIIKYASLEDYKNICNLISTIDTNTFLRCAHLPHGYSCYIPRSKTISLSSSTGAYTMIHEVCHAVQESERRYFDESECDVAKLNLSRKLIEI